MSQEQELSGKLDQILTILKKQKQIMNLDAFCAYTGFSHSFTYKLTSGNQIPFYRPSGKLIMFEKTEVDEWLTKNRIKPFSEITKNL